MRAQTDLACRFGFNLPRLKLALVHEDLHADQLYSIRCPEDAEDLLVSLKDLPEEHFVSLHLNARHEVIGLHEVSHGTLAASLVHPREVFKAAILANSFALLVCHNHPSGSTLSPSPEDMATTQQLLEASKVMGVSLIDHLIVGPGQRAYSIRENHPELWSKQAD